MFVSFVIGKTMRLLYCHPIASKYDHVVTTSFRFGGSIRESDKKATTRVGVVVPRC